MAGTTVRIREETREALRELERKTGEGTQVLLDRAVDQFRRSLILAETNVAYGNFREAALSETASDEDETREWEATLADGLDND